MKKLLTLFIVIAISASSSLAYGMTEPPKGKLTKEEKELLKEEKAELRKAEQRAKSDAKREARLAKQPSFDEFMLTYEPFKPVGNESVDLFCSQAHSMLMSYKELNDSINFIKIEIIQVPDMGDGITTEVKITDGNGNLRTKKDTNIKWVDISARFTIFGLDCALLITSGASTILELANNPENLFNGSVKQIKNSIESLKMLTVEMDRTTPILREQREMLKSVDEN